MSKYTTEVRYICETFSGICDTGNDRKVDGVIAASWDKIFSFPDSAIFDARYKKPLCCKILKHYYTNEICAETAQLWMLWLNSRMEEILPYYNQLYRSELLQFDPFTDANLKRTNTGNTQSNTSDNSTNTSKTGAYGASSGSSTSHSETKTTGNNTDRDLFSDTPQGGLTGVENETYLTTARKMTGNESGTSDTDTTTSTNTQYQDTTETTGSNQKTGNANTTEEYIELITGKSQGQTYSSMLNEFRETFLNIDKMIIEDLKDLFFNLW